MLVLYHTNQISPKKREKPLLPNSSISDCMLPKGGEQVFRERGRLAFPHSARPSVPSALLVFVHPRTVDIDCVGDRPRHISTLLAPATEKHINGLHQEPCLVTMAKHTGREEECWDGAAGSLCSLSGVVTPFLSSSHVCHTLYWHLLFCSALFRHINTIFLTHSPSYWCWCHQSALATHSTPLSNRATLSAFHLPLSL